ncbi:MAG: NACHT domain-containing protein [Cyanobacteria bacterium P01_D01_bin.156]
MSPHTQALANLIIDALGSRQGRFFGLLKKRPGPQTERAVFTAIHAYVNKFRERHGNLKILGMSKPVSLESVYVPLQLVENSELNQPMSMDDMEKACRTRREPELATTAPQKTIVDIANETPCLSIIGPPGAGKTTLMRKIGLDALRDAQETNYQYLCLPIWIDLRKFAEADLSFQNYITRELDTFDFPESEKITENVLKRGWFLILFDGLDEVSSHSHHRVLDRIEALVEQYGKNRYVISCRTAAYRSPSPSFREISLAGNGEEQIKSFIYNWFAAGEAGDVEAAETCWKSLQKADNVAVRELAQTPLLLTFLCLVYSRSHTFSGNRSMLYHQGLRILLKRWFEEKRVAKDTIYEGLHIELEEKLLAEIAYEAFKADNLLLTKANLVKHIRKFLLQELNAPSNLSGENILDAIVIQQGILVEQSEGIYSFSHLTFQEFLAAKYIHENYTNHALSEIVRQYANDRRWEEVFLLIAGLKYDETNVINLLRYLNQVAQGFINTNKLSALWLWATQVTADEPTPDKLIEKRANALYRAFHYSRILTESPELKGDLEIIQTLLQPFIYNLRATSDLTLTTLLINAFYTVSRQVKTTKKLGDPVFRKRTQTDLKKAVTLAKPLASQLRKRASVRSMRYLKNHEQPATIDTDLRNNEIFANADFPSLFEQLNRLSLNIPGIRYPSHVHQKFLDDLKHVCLGILKVQEAWLTLSKAEAKACQDCLYVTLLLLKCRKEAKRISLEQWQSVQEEILSLSAGGDRPGLLAAQSFLDQVGAVAKQSDNGSFLIRDIPDQFGIKPPLWVNVTSEVISQDVVNELYESSDSIRNANPELMGIVLYKDLPTKAARERMADLRLQQSFTVVPVALDAVETALPSRDTCEKLLLKQVSQYSNTVDFFQDKKAIHDPLLFFGRTQLLDQLIVDLNNNQSVGLFGLRKSGKSSILHQLALRCRDHAIIHIDMQKYSDIGIGYGIELLDNILQSLYALGKYRNPLLEQPPLLTEAGQPIKESSYEFYRCFRRLVKSIEGAGYQLPVLCFLDNLDRVFPRSHEKFDEKAEEFNFVFGALRALSRKEQCLSLVVTAIHPQCNRIKQWRFSKTFKNPLHRFFKESFLTPFSVLETSLLINSIGSLMRWEFDQQVIQQIHQLSGGHPFLIRKLASFLVQKAINQSGYLTNRRIPFAFAQMQLRKTFRDQSLKAYVQHGIISELRQYDSQLKVHRVLNAASVLTTASNSVDGWLRARTFLAFLSSKLNLSEIQCLDAVHVLENLGIVEQKEHPNGYDCYRIRVLLLHQWFQMLRKSKSA